MKVEVLRDEPRLIVVDNFLSPEEIAAIVTAGAPLLATNHRLLLHKRQHHLEERQAFLF